MPSNIMSDIFIVKFSFCFQTTYARIRSMHNIHYIRSYTQCQFIHYESTLFHFFFFFSLRFILLFIFLLLHEILRRVQTTFLHWFFISGSFVSAKSTLPRSFFFFSFFFLVKHHLHILLWMYIKMYIFVINCR